MCGDDGQVFVCACWVDTNHYVLALVVQNRGGLFTIRIIDSLGEEEEGGVPSDEMRDYISGHFRW